jgi:hypothetical protein
MSEQDIAPPSYCNIHRLEYHDINTRFNERQPEATSRDKRLHPDEVKVQVVTTSTAFIRTYI